MPMTHPCAWPFPPGVVCVSGDGLIHEVMAGLMTHAEPDAAIKTPIGIIPGGSGNGVAKSICW